MRYKPEMIMRRKKGRIKILFPISLFLSITIAFLCIYQNTKSKLFSNAYGIAKLAEENTSSINFFNSIIFSSRNETTGIFLSQNIFLF